MLPLHIPLSSAYLCLDCNRIGSESLRCPACASGVLLSLGTVLNRETLSSAKYASGPAISDATGFAD